MWQRVCHRVFFSVFLTGIFCAAATPDIFAQSPSALMAGPQNRMLVVDHALRDALRDASSDTTRWGIAVAYEVRLHNVGATTVKAYDNGTDVLCPIEPISALTGVAWDRRGDHILINGTPLSTSDATFVEDVPYFSIRSFAQAVGVEARILRHTAAIILANADSLPAVKRAARIEARLRWQRQRLQPSKALGDIEAPSSSTKQWGGLALDYSLHGTQYGPTRVGGAQIATTTGIAGGSLIWHLTGNSVAMGDDHWHSELQWRRVWGNGSPVTQLVLGQTWATGTSPVQLRGFTISNAPYTRPTTLSFMSLGGALPSDWNVEVHRHGELIGFDSVDASGQYTIPVPVEYGENPYTITAYGPHGEMRAFTRVVRTLPDMIAPGAFEYAASGGACLSAACQWMTNAELRYGLSARITVRGGASQYTWKEASGRDMHPYLAVSAVPVNPIGLSVEHMAGTLWRGNLSFDPLRSLSVFGNYVRYARTRSGAFHGGIGGREQMTAVIRLMPWGYRHAFDLQALGMRDSLGHSGFVRMSTTVTTATGMLRPYVRLTQSHVLREDFVGMEVTILPVWRFLTRGGPMWLRGGIERSTHGEWNLWNVRATRMIHRSVNAELGVQWSRHTPGTRFTLAVNMNMPKFRATTSAASGYQRQSGQITQQIRGSVHWNETTGAFVPSRDFHLGRSGVAGAVFVDHNANGVFDGGDEPLHNVRIRVGGTHARSASDGHFSAWGVQVMEPLAVSVDTASLGSPWLTPQFNRTILQAAPDRVTQVNIPVVKSGIIDGQVRCQQSPCSGMMTVRLVHTETGLVRVLDTFRDGSFYQMGLLPGPYVAVATMHDGTTLRQSQPVSVTITGGETTPSVVITLPVSSQE